MSQRRLPLLLLFVALLGWGCSSADNTDNKDNSGGQIVSKTLPGSRVASPAADAITGATNGTTTGGQDSGDLGTGGTGTGGTTGNDTSGQDPALVMHIINTVVN